jgi:hypothetical protein
MARPAPAARSLRLVAAAVLLCLAAAPRPAAAQASQGASLAAIAAALKPQGWPPVDAAADACAAPGTATPGVVCSGSTVTEM